MDKRAKRIPASWQPHIDSWLAALLAGGTSPQTVRLRRAHLARLSRSTQKAPSQLVAADLIAYLASRDWSRETRRAVLATFRGFFRFIDRGELVEHLPRVRTSSPAPRPAPTDVYQIALASADSRVRLMLRLGAELGLRRGEIAQINLADIGEDLLGLSLMVHGKGNKIRFIPISGELACEMRRQSSPAGWVFAGSIDGHLSADRVGKLVANALPGRWTAHTLRHRFATRAYAGSDDLLAVSRLLGHASVATTQRYVATDAARLRKVAMFAA